MKITLEIPDNLIEEIDEEIIMHSNNACDLGSLPSDGAWAEFQGIWAAALEKAKDS